jgi:hypothetical protein
MPSKSEPAQRREHLLPTVMETSIPNPPSLPAQIQQRYFALRLAAMAERLALLPGQLPQSSPGGAGATIAEALTLHLMELTAAIASGFLERSGFPAVGDQAHLVAAHPVRQQPVPV